MLTLSLNILVLVIALSLIAGIVIGSFISRNLLH
ncbi:hypothetical protein ES703_87652 [subsurface metagenome]